MSRFQRGEGWGLASAGAASRSQRGAGGAAAGGGASGAIGRSHSQGVARLKWARGRAGIGGTSRSPRSQRSHYHPSRSRRVEEWARADDGALAASSSIHFHCRVTGSAKSCLWYHFAGREAGTGGGALAAIHYRCRVTGWPLYAPVQRERRCVRSRRGGGGRGGGSGALMALWVGEWVNVNCIYFPKGGSRETVTITISRLLKRLKFEKIDVVV